MIIKGKSRIILVVIVMIISLFQNCATITRGTSQKIPVTSNPIGAKIIVDGEEIGSAPLVLKLMRKKSHNIRIEKEGYNPFKIRINQKGNPGSLFLSVLGNLLFWPCLGEFYGKATSQGTGYYEQGMLVWYLPIVISMVVDFNSGSLKTLSPKQLDVTLSPNGDKSALNFILIDEEQLQNIKWIRIRCVG